MRMLCNKLREGREREREEKGIRAQWVLRGQEYHRSQQISHTGPRAYSRECCVRMDEEHVKETRGRHWRDFGM
jgi:hypothetical protein